MKLISVERLSWALSLLEDLDEVFVNAAGQLGVLRDGDYIGYIDFTTGNLELEEQE